MRGSPSGRNSPLAVSMTTSPSSTPAAAKMARLLSEFFFFFLLPLSVVHLFNKTVDAVIFVYWLLLTKTELSTAGFNL